MANSIGTFYTHIITVPKFTPNIEKDYVTKHILKAWKKKDSKDIKILVELNDNLLQEGRFTARNFLSHSSINDKLIYVFATIYKHFNKLLLRGLEEHACIMNFVEKLNAKTINDFEKLINLIETLVAKKIEELLFAEDSSNKVNSLDKQPKVELKFLYTIPEDSSRIQVFDSDAYLDLGIIKNEEFYAAICSDPWKVADWICSPYAAILTGSEEQSLEDTKKMYKIADKLLKKAWRAFKVSRIKELFNKETEYILEDCPDLIFNPGKAIISRS